ncbi:hypothetical protein PHYBLDRAFT_75844 [Phycomyces blakesleeanus NRRL 1555(-)]|uniref:Uncharacterized protein n=1 Tax=Phycomyces blakesleeanus (strain ATCC 8743b / DSM 1359 / FGSC 10004 / NBRC 33097 / NRRL 1555) TaxID=763407 RepID=A0A162XMT8_PHYB8|nr:hypothetical protein PHYBLDRAFT_75844 [Phycomyces blakesleeanus NRRL 1555(-)]OAD75755.1 hypothetical protein PHYBLDRAFT_75844 [Phycomyces blakesleeanus NRRL 1555(-)]|eukprot:XP_018293795.1 hypothetical protein PHYBLDRAFT_75844 [Phycomyces blakesleeanus NRRL 1555(-)]
MSLINESELRVNPIEQQQEQLGTLKSLRQKTQLLVDCKASLTQHTEALDIKQGLLEEATSERQRLQKEKKVLLEMIHSVQRDMEAVTEIEKSLGKERDNLKQTVQRIRDQEYEPLHEQVNVLRAENGLQKLPSVEQEIEAQMAKHLEDRREKWQQTPPVEPTNRSRSGRWRA